MTELNPLDPNSPANTPNRKTIVEAVLGLIEKIKVSIKQRQASGVAMDQEEAARLRVEINDALKMISNLQDVKLSETLNNAVAPLCQESPPTSWDKWMASLETFQRLLEARLAVLGSPSAIDRRAAQTAPPEGSPTGATRDEDALIGRVNERLFGSWGPRTVFACFVAAVALAIGGPLVIGGTTLNIRQALLDAGKAAKEDLSEIAKTAKSTADAQVKLVEGTSETAQTKIRSEQDRVITQLSGLKDSAVKEVIEKLDLGREVKPLRDRIEKAATAFAAEIEELSLQRLTPLSTRIGTLSGGLSVDEQKQRVLHPSSFHSKHSAAGSTRSKGMSRYRKDTQSVPKMLPTRRQLRNNMLTPPKDTAMRYSQNLTAWIVK